MIASGGDSTCMSVAAAPTAAAATAAKQPGGAVLGAVLAGATGERLMRCLVWVLLSLGATANLAGAAVTSPAKSLDIYYIDTEGGQSTLFVAPGGQTVLIDTGFPGTRDSGRVLDAIHAAGVKQIDYLLITHFHSDHVGGYLGIAKEVPILHFVDHGPTAQPERTSDSKVAYDEAILHNPHMLAKPGDKLPIPGLDWTIVSAGGKTLEHNMADAPGAGAANPLCAAYSPKEIKVELENAESVGSVIRYGKFRTVDLGDLLWNLEGALACPVNRIGTVDLLLTSHHGLSWSGPKALVHALRPRVVVMNNGTRKGGDLETFDTLETSPGLENLWQLHWSVNGLLDHNVPARFIANLESVPFTAAMLLNPPPQPVLGTKPETMGDPDHAPAYWIKVSAFDDGSFTVTNARNGFSKNYGRRGS
jgi:beta-lactamase superfamily II metal-dependent hydrolase